MSGLRAVPKIKAPGTAAAMIAVATSQVGFREGSNNANPYGAWYGMNNVAWCAEFVSWAAAVSGNSKVIPKHAYTPAGAAWFKSRGLWGTKPKVGAIVYYYNASMGRISHVGLVTKVNADGSWTACEGNTNNTGSRTGNGVYLLKRTTTRGGGFGYPKYAKAATPVLPAPPVVVLPVVGQVPIPNPTTFPVLTVVAEDVLTEAHLTGKYTGPVAGALAVLGLTDNVAGYRNLQSHLGYTGSDADGYAGPASLAWLCNRFGLTYKES